MTRCPHCGSPDIFVGAHLLECPTAGCHNYTARQAFDVRAAQIEAEDDDDTLPMFFIDQDTD